MPDRQTQIDRAVSQNEPQSRPQFDFDCSTERPPVEAWFIPSPQRAVYDWASFILGGHVAPEFRLDFHSKHALIANGVLN